MRRLMASSAAAAMLPAAAAPAAAQPIPSRVTAKALTAVCAEDRSACLTYILGAVDSFVTMLALTKRPQAFCIPRGTTNDQIAQRAVRYLRARPQEGDTNAAVVVIAGLREAWPCGY